MIWINVESGRETDRERTDSQTDVQRGEQTDVLVMSVCMSAILKRGAMCSL